MKLSRIITIVLLFSLAVFLAGEFAASVSSQLSDAEGPGDAGLPGGSGVAGPPEIVPAIPCAEPVISAGAGALAAEVSPGSITITAPADPVVVEASVDAPVPAPVSTPIQVSISPETMPAPTVTINGETVPPGITSCQAGDSDITVVNNAQCTEAVAADGECAVATNSAYVVTTCVPSDAGNSVTTYVSNADESVTLTPVPGVTVTKDNGLTVDVAGIGITGAGITVSIT